MCATVFYLVGRIGLYIYEANIHSMIMSLRQTRRIEVCFQHGKVFLRKSKLELRCCVKEL